MWMWVSPECMWIIKCECMYTLVVSRLSSRQLNFTLFIYDDTFVSFLGILVLEMERNSYKTNDILSILYIKQLDCDKQ